MTKLLMPTGELVTNTLPVWKTPNNHDTTLESDRTATYFKPDSGLTKQEFKDECDINVILDRFMKTGQPPALSLPEHFADATNRTTYFDAACAAAEANELFYLLPAKKRAEFLNDPTRWADAVVDALNNEDREALIEMGIQVNAKPQEPDLADPPSGGTPDLKSGQKAPEASIGGEPPKPPTDKEKIP